MSLGGAAVAGTKRKPTAKRVRQPRRNAKWIEAAASVREWFQMRSVYLDWMEAQAIEGLIGDLEAGGR